MYRFIIKTKYITFAVLLILFGFSFGSVAQAHDVALLAAELPERVADVETKLEATGLFNTVDVIDINAGTPSLAQLEQYCAVLVWSDFPVSDPVAMGNVLADYVDRGGAVVTAIFANLDNAGFPALKLAGRWGTDNYWAIQPADFTFGVNGSIGSISLPGHPILAGVTSFDGGTGSYHLVSNTLHPQATRVADWSFAGNIPLIATRSIKSARRVDLGFFPVSSDVDPTYWNSATDGDRILANALLWVCPFDENGPAVAIMGSPGLPEWNYDVRAKLLSQRVFSRVDVFDTNTVVPSVLEMQNYCSILAYTDGGPDGPDPVTYGNNLADYIDSGGGVVTAVFAHTASVQITGRFDTDDYWVIEPGGFSPPSPQTLGTVHSPANPLMAGVRTFSGGTSSYRSGSVLRPGSTRVANWNSGEILMATRIINAVKRVDLGFFPVSKDARSDFWDTTTDGARMMTNALLYTCPSAKSSVAILGADFSVGPNLDVQNKIKQTGKFSNVDVIAIDSFTPTLNHLLPYSGVMVWTNIPPLDPVTLGNNLADYVDQGGGVVTALASFVPNFMVQGRFNTDNYWAITPGGTTIQGTATLGVVTVPTHPIMFQVSTFNGGTFSGRQNTLLDPSAQLIASWSDGIPMIATRLRNNVRRVDLNIFPPSADTFSTYWNTTTHGTRIMANALQWVSTRFKDDFNDLDANDWSPVKGIWTAASGALAGTHNRKGDILAPFQCGANCSIGGDITILNPGARGSLIGWFLDKKNYVEVRLFEDRDKVLLIQKSNGFKVAKDKALTPIVPGITYQVRVEYDGSVFSVYLDGNLLFTAPSGVPASGRTGARIKSTTGANATALFDRIIIY